MKKDLCIEDLYVSYGTKKVLRGVNLDAQRGETIIITGASGEGKTTLLRTIIGLEEPAKGRVVFLRETIGKKNNLLLKRKMGIVFQKPVALNRSVYDNVAYGLSIRGVSPEETERRVKEILTFVGIPKRMYYLNALRLSGGEIQRIAFARSLVTEPELLLLDEPTANLDDENVEKIEGLLRSIMKKKNMIIIIATHNKEQARRLGNQYHLENGKITLVKT